MRKCKRNNFWYLKEFCTTVTTLTTFDIGVDLWILNYWYKYRIHTYRTDIICIKEIEWAKAMAPRQSPNDD